jgi:hypothetical protein
MKTLGDLTGSTGRDVDLHLMLDLVIPVHEGIQAQGDVIVVPLAEVAGDVKVQGSARWREVPADGIELLRGGTGGNAHTLVADPGTCVFTADVFDPTGLALGVFEAMATVYLLHREHGGTGVAPGAYIVRRQREHGPAVPAREVTSVARTAAVPRALLEQRAAAAAAEATATVRFVAD